MVLFLCYNHNSGDDMNIEYIISQVLGAIGYGLLAYSFFKKEKKEILFIQILAYIGFTTHYILLHAVTGTVCNILGFIALILIYILGNNKKKKRILVFILIPILISMAYLSYENIYSIFPVIGCLISFITFLSDNTNLIRLVGIISAGCWLIYALVYKSYSAIIFETITVISSAVAYIKNKKRIK